jgi:hypothetical protein
LITGTPNGNTYINPSPLDNPLGVPVIKRGGVYICIAIGSSSYEEERGLYMCCRWEFQLSRGQWFIYVLPSGVPVIKRAPPLLITGTPNGNTYINPSPLDNWNSQWQYIYKSLSS